MVSSAFRDSLRLEMRFEGDAGTDDQPSDCTSRTIEAGFLLRFSRTLDEASPSPAKNDRESPGKRGYWRELMAADHRECRRSSSRSISGDWI